MISDLVDQPESVRPSEALDTGNLESYLSERLANLDGPVTVAQFRQGYSNLTYLLRFGDRELVLRRPPPGANIKTAHDMGREYRILSHLIEVYPKVPRPLLYCEDPSVLGAPFYVMERVKGIILRTEVPLVLVASPEQGRRLAESFIHTLVELHQLDYQSAGLGDLGKPEGYVVRQIEGWTRRYQNARTDDLPEVERIARWLAEHLPPESPGCLIHNDYKYDNIVLHPREPTRILAVLDWEMATLGDPLMDLGTTLGYWADPDDPEEWQNPLFGVTTVPGSFCRSELVEQYARKTRWDLSNAVFYFVFALLKITATVQQIYFRYKQGWTQDERFARLMDIVRGRIQAAMLAIEKNRIDRLVA